MVGSTRYGWPEDVWFHVDKLSSAHVYLRLKEGESLDDVPTNVIEEAAQLVKANSIQASFSGLSRSAFMIVKYTHHPIIYWGRLYSNYPQDAPIPQTS